MVDLAPLLRGLVVVVSSSSRGGGSGGGRWHDGRMVILGLGVAVGLGLGVLGLDGARPLRSFYSRHCLVEPTPIGPCGYATGVDFVAHLSRACGFSQQLEMIRWHFRSTCFSLGLAALLVVRGSRFAVRTRLTEGDRLLKISLWTFCRTKVLLLCRYCERYLAHEDN